MQTEPVKPQNYKWAFSDNLGWLKELQFHPTPLKALEGATGAVVYVKNNKKLTACIDCSELLCQFARECALDVIQFWKAPEVVIQFLKTGNEELRNAARSAARSAAESAARSAVWSAAWNAARSAARSAQNTKLEQMILARMKHSEELEHATNIGSKTPDYGAGAASAQCR